ncbi:hypothetical protein ABPG72_017568 [Tetrahymena utriculariae]
MNIEDQKSNSNQYLFQKIQNNFHIKNEPNIEISISLNEVSNSVQQIYQSSQQLFTNIEERFQNYEANQKATEQNLQKLKYDNEEEFNVFQIYFENLREELCIFKIDFNSGNKIFQEEIKKQCVFLTTEFLLIQQKFQSIKKNKLEQQNLLLKLRQEISVSVEKQLLDFQIQIKKDIEDSNKYFQITFMLKSDSQLLNQLIDKKLSKILDNKKLEQTNNNQNGKINNSNNSFLHQQDEILSEYCNTTHNNQSKFKSAKILPWQSFSQKSFHGQQIQSMIEMKNIIQDVQTKLTQITQINLEQNSQKCLLILQCFFLKLCSFLLHR